MKYTSFHYVPLSLMALADSFCLSSNLSAAHSYLLRYLPPLVATVVLCFVWLIRYGGRDSGTVFCVVDEVYGEEGGRQGQ